MRFTFGAALIEGMKLILAPERGEIQLEKVWPNPSTSKPFAKALKYPKPILQGLLASANAPLQEWDREPDSAARAYLTVIAKEPRMVRRALLRKRAANQNFLIHNLSR